MGTMEITLFGTLGVQSAGNPHIQFPSGKVKHLFAYLLLNRHTIHPRERLAGLFWGDEDDHRARHCLNTALWRLNRILSQPELRTAGYLRVDAQNIGFNTASDFWLDVDEFEVRCTLAEQLGPDAPDDQAALYRQAVACYSADLLIDCYEDWCLIERERFRCMYLRALSRLLAHHTAARDYDAAIDCARRILACDHLREEIHRDLMHLYLVTDQPADALRQYRTCEGLLRRELAVEPMPETRALLARIIAATARPARRGRDEASMTFAGLGADATMIEKLTAAAAHLRGAAGTFDRSRIQVQEATALIEQVVNHLGERPAPPDAADAVWPAAADQLHHVAMMLDDVVRAFAHLPDPATPLAAVGVP
ncbi:MAG: AfsR/SARP family transcriptional regulator [Thermomicrobiales bacterium]